jgi:glycosyltransferase involved in cell wall biosynthesis
MLLATRRKTPQVAVLMSAFNSEGYIAEAITSILTQSFEDFALLVIDDGSSDSTFEIVMSFDDLRITALRLDHNHGLAAALNVGLGHIRSPYVARMDADDVSFKQRLDTQVSFMQENPEIGFCGSFVESFGQERLRFIYPTDHPHLAVSLLSYNPIAHPTVMFRREIFEKYHLQYRKAYSYCEDYDLWSRASRFVRIANLPLSLLKYRLHDAQVTNRHNQIQQPNARRVRIRQMEYLCDGLAARERELYIKMIGGLAEFELPLKDEVAALKQKILTKNYQKRLYDSVLLARALDEPCLEPIIVALEDDTA